MATYKYCSGSTLYDVNVTLSAATCGDCTTWTAGGCDYEECYQDITIYLDLELEDDLDIWYTNRYYQLVQWNGGSHEEEETQTTKVTIPAGVTAHTITRDCSWLETCQGEQYDDTDSKVWDTWAMGAQQELPACGSCALKITGHTLTAPTIRGDSDGSIYVILLDIQMLAHH